MPEEDYESLGYAHPLYAHSLSEFGKPRRLPRSGGWLLEREIPGTPYRDAMGCYPLFSCIDWSGIEDDLAELEDELVSVALVTDLFGNYTPEQLVDCFDVAVPFKEHFVSDLSCPLESFVSKMYRRHARKALRAVSVSLIMEPHCFLDEWTALYANLVERHDIAGIRAFSRESFDKQLRIPGLRVFAANCGDQTVAAYLVIEQGDAVYGHLIASTQLGYELHANYALKWVSLMHYSGSKRFYDHGGRVGLNRKAVDHLSEFKQKWASETRMAYFCGRILNRRVYSELAARNTDPTSGYFPAYREGEFGGPNSESEAVESTPHMEMRNEDS